MNLLSMLGLVIAVIGSVWLLLVIFQTSILWGVFSLIAGLGALLFVLMHWQESRKPFLVYVAGVILYGAGVSMGGDPNPFGL